MKVTIGIPVFNCESWIAQAIESALSQSWPNKEVIVVDDGSTDQTSAVCKSFGDRIRILQQPNLGGNAARNRICRAASGEWIQYLDADDYLKPDKIRSQIEGYPAINDADVLCSATTQQVWIDGKLASETIFSLEEDCDWISLWLTWCMPQTGGCLWRRAALRQIGGWNEQLKCNQEYELYFRAFRNGLRFRVAGAPLSVYRIWSETTVCRRDKKTVVFGITDLVHHFIDWLKEQGKLTANYQQIAAEGCFRLARTLAAEDLSMAERYYRERKREGLIQAAGTAAPWKYRLALRYFGFSAAERLAKILR